MPRIADRVGAADVARTEPASALRCLMVSASYRGATLDAAGVFGRPSPSGSRTWTVRRCRAGGMATARRSETSSVPDVVDGAARHLDGKRRPRPFAADAFPRHLAQSA